MNIFFWFNWFEFLSDGIVRRKQKIIKKRERMNRRWFAKFSFLFCFCRSENWVPNWFGWLMVEVLQQPLYVWPVLWSWSKQTAWSWFCSFQLNSVFVARCLCRSPPIWVFRLAHTRTHAPCVDVSSIDEIFTADEMVHTDLKATTFAYRVERLDGRLRSDVDALCVSFQPAFMHDPGSARVRQMKNVLILTLVRVPLLTRTHFCVRLALIGAIASLAKLVECVFFPFGVRVLCTCMHACVCEGISGWKHCIIYCRNVMEVELLEYGILLTTSVRAAKGKNQFFFWVSVWAYSIDDNWKRKFPRFTIHFC